MEGKKRRKRRERRKKNYSKRSHECENSGGSVEVNIVSDTRWTKKSSTIGSRAKSM
jgi:hypothetical protein